MLREKIENKIKKYSDKDYAFLTGNGTSAIFLALKVSSIPKGSKIAIPNISCPDPVYALIWAGYKPVFIDVNIEDYNMNVERLEEALIADTQIKGIIAIHLFGNSCDIITISKLAKKYNNFLLEDCAQSFGNSIKEGKLGSFGDVSIFSFGSGKIIEAGHGGSIQTNDNDFIKKIKIEYKNLKIYNRYKVEKLGKLHRIIYYKLYYLGIKYPILNILNIVYIYFFKNYYLYRLEEKNTTLINFLLDDFKNNRERRIYNINRYKDNLKDKVSFPRFNNQEDILSRLTVNINDAEKLSKKIRNNNISSNTMYPMLVDRFNIFFNKKYYKNSYILKGKQLNLWLNNISDKDLELLIKIIKDENE